MKPIDRILVLTDFSEGATPPVEYAIGLAKAAEARLFLLHTGLASVPESTGSYVAGAFANGTSVAYPPAIIQKQAPTLALYLTGQAVAYELILTEDRLEVAIRRTIDQEAIDLIVMGSEGYDTGHVESENAFDGLRTYQAQQREATMIAIMCRSYQQGEYETRSYFPNTPFESQPLFIY